MKDPVYGCVGAISVLQGQVQQLQRELAEARADLARFTAMEMGMQGIHGFPFHQPSHSLLELRREQVIELARLQGSGISCSEALAGVAAAGIYNIKPSSPPPPPSLPSTHPPPVCTTCTANDSEGGSGSGSGSSRGGGGGSSGSIRH